MTKVRAGSRLRPAVGLFAAAVLSTFSPVGQAEDGMAAESSGSGGTIDAAAGGAVPYSFSGFLRFETAYKTTDKDNIVNQRGNPFNGRTVHREPFGTFTGNDLDAARNGRPADDDWNLMQARGKLDFTADFSEHIRLFMSARGIFDLTPYDKYDPSDIGSNAVGYNYKKPQYFAYNHYHHGAKNWKAGGALNPLELDGRRAMVDLPSAYLDFQYGALLIRAGQQQIAWGQALFFRVLDVPNGLDLRRHLFLDYAPEEYADERVPALGVRATYQLTNEWELDGFVQKFQPTTYPNANTPYNAIASQFSVHDHYSKYYDDKVNEGMRIRGNFGAWGVQAIAVRRYNPDGIFRWTKSGVVRDIPGLAGTGGLMSQTPLEVDTSGVWSAGEWFTYAGAARLDGVAGLNSLINEFQASQDLGGVAVETVAQAAAELDQFQSLAGGAAAGTPNSGGLRGHIKRTYDQESVFGLGGSYVFSGAPGSLTDQLIVNLETSYTPNKQFTPSDLSQIPITKDEVATALVMEKYQRFSQGFPATYLVFQAIHKTQSDLFGRYLGCQGGTGRQITADGDRFGNGANKRCSDIQDSGFTALVFAFQQPSPTLSWRADFALLYDVRGGILMQPAIRYSPNTSVTLEVFYNYLNGSVNGKDNQNIIQTIDYADELGIRLGYQF